MLQVNRAYNENDVILMRSKINIILKLYLNSDIPPKLRVSVGGLPPLSGLVPRSISSPEPGDLAVRHCRSLG